MNNLMILWGIQITKFFGFLHMIKVSTIGFTQTNASDFFTALKISQVNKLIDVRLNNISQLAGFAKKNDLKYFLKAICDVEYVHLPELAPTKEILDPYKKGNGSWKVYEDQFINLMEKRAVEKSFDVNFFDQSCLLCSEKEPHYCHRRLVVEYLNQKWGGNLEVKHLV